MVRRHHVALAAVSSGCSTPQGTFPRVTHPSAAPSEESARLACVKPAASVRSEPGSNSQVETRQRSIPGPRPGLPRDQRPRPKPRVHDVRTFAHRHPLDAHRPSRTPRTQPPHRAPKRAQADQGRQRTGKRHPPSNEADSRHHRKASTPLGARYAPVRPSLRDLRPPAYPFSRITCQTAGAKEPLPLVPQQVAVRFA